MNYSTEKDDYLMTTPYTKKIQQKFEKVKSFLEQNGFNPSSESLMQDIVSSEEYICLLYTSPSPRDPKTSRMPSSA